MKKLTRASAVATIAAFGLGCAPPQDAIDIKFGSEEDPMSWEEARPQFMLECGALGLGSSACECLYLLVQSSFDSVEDYARSTEAPPGFEVGFRRCAEG